MVSVVMSVYNGEKYLNEAIRSILNQAFQDFEFIIVDDGSKDRSSEIIRSFNDPRILIISHENRGLSASLNAGIRVASGKYIARMDADDISSPHRLDLQFHYMEGHPECVLLGGAIEYIDAEGAKLYTRSFPTDDARLKGGLPLSVQIVHPASMYRRADFLGTIGYREDVKKHIEDILLWNEFSKLGRFANLSDVVLKYRISPSSISGHNRFDVMRRNRIVLKLVAHEDFTPKDAHFLENLGKESQSEKMARYYSRLGLIYMSQNNYSTARSYLRKSLSSTFSCITLYHYIQASFRQSRSAM